MFTRFLGFTRGHHPGCSNVTAGRRRQSAPVCDALHVGQFWPEITNVSHQSVQESAKRGELQVCSRTSGWKKYKWEQLTVTLDQLESTRKKTDASRREPAS